MAKKKTQASSIFSMLPLLVLGLSLLGLFFVFEASTAESFASHGHQYHFVQRQAMWLVVGLVFGLIAYLVPLSWWQKLSGLWYVLSLLLLAAVFIPGLGVELNGARRWIGLGPVSLQPVEVVKLSLTLFFSTWMSRHQRLAPFIFLTALPCCLLLLQPDMGSLLIVGAISLGLYFVAGGAIKQLLPVVATAVIGLTLAIVSSSYRLKRLKTFLNPNLDPLGASFHIKQIIIALGNGGLFGQGLGNSQQKYAYIPEASSDSIFAIVAEEVGFIGSFIILAVFISYFYLLFRLAQQQKPQSFAQLCLIGILLWLAGQTLLNLGAVVALVPLTGLPLPFFSYGGSSLVMALLANGLVLKIRAQTKL